MFHKEKNVVISNQNELQFCSWEAAGSEQTSKQKADNYYFLLHYNMSLIGSVSGFAAFGVLVRTYALGLQKRPVFSSEYC